MTSNKMFSNMGGLRLPMNGRGEPACLPIFNTIKDNVDSEDIVDNVDRVLNVLIVHRNHN
jgi:hypothetical protein